MKGQSDLGRVGLALVFLLAIVISGPVQAQTMGSITSVRDGDTLRVRVNGNAYTIRIACIDSAELSQAPHGQQAKERLQQLLPVGTQVSLDPQTKDRYGRIVAEVFKGSLNVGLSLVQEGQAVAYRNYLAPCSAASSYLKAEASARDKKLAFWSQTNPVMPWDYRRGGNRPQPWTAFPSSAPKPTSAPCDPSYPDVCIPSYPPDLDCHQISHRRFRVTGADPHKFDGNKDGVGCER